MVALVKLGLRPILLVLSCCAASCVQTGDESTVDRFALEGRVVDDSTGDGLSGAKVTFVSDTLDKTEARSDGDGRYSMNAKLAEGVTFGTLRAEHPGYRTSIDQTVYFDGTAREVDLRLRASGL